jgi:hypothetical protein
MMSRRMIYDVTPLQLDAHPDAVEIFLQHGVDVPSECDESILDTELAICDSMCHVDDLDGLMRDLQKFIDAKTTA